MLLTELLTALPDAVVHGNPQDIDIRSKFATIEKFQFLCAVKEIKVSHP